MSTSTPAVYTWNRSSAPPGDDRCAPLVWYRPTDHLDDVVERLTAQTRRALFIRHAEGHDPRAFDASLAQRMAAGLDHRPGFKLWLARFMTLAEHGLEPDLVVTEVESQASIGYQQLRDMLEARGMAFEEADRFVLQLVKRVRLYPTAATGPLAGVNVDAETSSIEDRMLISDHACSIVWEWLDNTIGRAWREVYSTDCPLSNYGYAPFTMADPKAHRMQRVSVPLAAPVCYVRPERLDRDTYAAMLTSDLSRADTPMTPWVSPRYYGTSHAGTYAEPDAASLRVMRAVAGHQMTRAVIWWSSEIERALTGDTVIQAERAAVTSLCDLFGAAA